VAADPGWVDWKGGEKEGEGENSRYWELRPHRSGFRKREKRPGGGRPSTKKETGKTPGEKGRRSCPAVLRAGILLGRPQKEENIGGETGRFTDWFRSITLIAGFKRDV